ncbi:MAG TPA: hypothetical protein VK629_12220, partial [Steroidobacteraceae bacterium]|nr:hypothetical protein [Steroidobacteraceae bacterium]
SGVEGSAEEVIPIRQRLPAPSLFGAGGFINLTSLLLQSLLSQPYRQSSCERDLTAQKLDQRLPSLSGVAARESTD